MVREKNRKRRFAGTGFSMGLVKKTADTGVGTLQVRGSADSNAAAILGLIPEGETVSTATSDGTTDTISI